ncbi:MAG TPA: lipoyl(octanoyl) transferase LipB [Gemmatimonadales bacterium]|nr:lipoyl(octanoyl) transferase LipB [Gemmatimonadales bacterium]
MSDPRTIAVLRLGRVSYTDALALQQRLAQARAVGQVDRDILLLLEHEPTITMGRGTRPSSLPIAPEVLAGRGLTVAEVDRGGDVTWHGPGQLVGYPILDLQAHRADLHWYLRQVEEAVIGGLGRIGVAAARRAGLTGVWVGSRKIASIGVHVRHWVTTHGFALNLTNRLDDFALIVPCGLNGVELTTVALELERLGAPVPDPASLWQRAEAALAASLGETFQREPVAATLASLLPDGTEAPIETL